MSNTVYEFPLKEKVRNYLRIEYLLTQLKTGASVQNPALQIYFFEQLFTLMDLFERIDLRTDLIKDLDVYERNLVHWSRHPNIDSNALEQTLRSTVNLKDKLKAERKFGSALKEDKFLSSIRQRFAIPGGTCSFDLPSLHYWLNQPQADIQENIKVWLKSLTNLENTIAILLACLREKAPFVTTSADNGFYQGVSDDKCELIRVRCEANKGFYPVLSGNKYRYVIRFMLFEAEQGQSPSVENTVTFGIAAC